MTLFIFTKYDLKGASSRLRLFPLHNSLQSKYKVVLQNLLDEDYLISKYKKVSTVVLFFKVLKLYYRRLLFLRQVKQGDLLIIEKELFPFFPFAFEFLIKKILRVNFILDYDDPIFLNYRNSNFLVRLLLRNKIQKLCTIAEHVVCCSDFIYDEIEAHSNKISQVITVPDTKKFDINRIGEIDIPDGKKIIWSGSPSTYTFLENILMTLSATLKDVSIIIVGVNKENFKNVYFYEWSQDVENYLISVSDIGIMPLDNSDWSKGKCGFKLIKYMSFGLPVVASPVGINKELIEAGKNGFFASSEKEFPEKVNEILGDNDMRLKFSSRSLQLYSENFLLENYLNQYTEIIESALNLHSTFSNKKIIESFGNEWGKFNYINNIEFMEEYFYKYFNILFKNVNFEDLKKFKCIDFGAGSGRWDFFLANKVKSIRIIEPSNAIFPAKKLLKNFDNISFYKSTITQLSDAKFNNYADLSISLGVLHHIPEFQKSLEKIYNYTKPGGFFIGYLYYSAQEFNSTNKIIFNLASFFRFFISRSPNIIKNFICDLIALLVYFPLSRISRLFKQYKEKIPLSFYANSNFYIMRNDSRDRFGTSYEERYTMKEINEILSNIGFVNIQFSKNEPKWTFICCKPKK